MYFLRVASAAHFLIYGGINMSFSENFKAVRKNSVFNSGGNIECFLCRYNLWYDKKYKFFGLSIDFCVDLWYFCFIQFINFVRRV